MFYLVTTAAKVNGKVPNLTRRTMCGDLTLEFGERETDMETEAETGGFEDIQSKAAARKCLQPLRNRSAPSLSNDLTNGPASHVPGSSSSWVASAAGLGWSNHVDILAAKRDTL